MVVRLLVGSDEADARTYQVRVAWDGNPALTASGVLESLDISIDPADVWQPLTLDAPVATGSQAGPQEAESG